MAKQAAQNVKNAAQRVRAPGKRGREDRLEQRPFRDAHIDQVVESIIEQYLRIENHDHVDAEKHPEHVLVEQEIDRILALRIGPGKIEYHALALAPHRAFDLERACAHAVVADVIFKGHRRFADRVGNQVLHRAMVAGEQFLRGGDIDIIAKPVGHFDDAARRHAA